MSSSSKEVGRACIRKRSESDRLMDGTAAERTETDPEAERTETAPGRTISTEVFLVRHGERVDETAEAPLFYLNCGDRGWDPPLTQEGRRQADSAGRELLRAHQRRPFSCVLYSPCLRTLETAARIATVLGLPLRCVPGLAECAAAVKSRRIASFDPSNTSCSRPHRFLTQEQALAHCPAGVRFLSPERRYEKFAAAVERAAASGGRVLCVTHREGIRDLAEATGVRGRIKTKYCCIARFAYDQNADAPAAWTMLEAPTVELSDQAAPRLPPELPE